MKESDVFVATDTFSLYTFFQDNLHLRLNSCVKRPII